MLKIPSLVFLAIMFLINLLSIQFFVFQFGVSGLIDFWFDKFFFNRLFLFILPLYTCLFAFNCKKLGILDFSYFYVPPVIWFWLVILGGSGTNHLIVNPAMIGCVSGLYLLRFYLQYFESKPVKGTVLLWLLILVICSIIHMVLPTFPE